MRQNYKKTLAAMVLGVSVLGLTACGSTATVADEITTISPICSLWLTSW